VQDTRPLLLESDFPPLQRAPLETVQVNLGYLCNMSCVHCHVNAGPTRTELMDRDTVDTLIEVMRTKAIKVLDLTGGAPELNPHFRYLVSAARALGVEVIDRCNLTVLFEPGQEDLAQFLADNQVVVTASLPCYSKDNVEEDSNYASIGSFQFYPEQNKLVKQATEISLSKKECELLAIFVSRPNQTITRDELTKRVWEDNGVIVGRSLDTYISKLRKILKDDDAIKITNGHGFGYKFEVE